MTQAAIEIEGVSKQFDENQVLRGMSLRVTAGQTFAFLGRNGAGKTTTIRMLLGLLYEVEPVADVVAILDQGVIRRLAPTEALRADVKRIIFRAEVYNRLEQSLSALDVCRSDDEVATTVDSAPEVLARLAASGCAYRVVDLNLDEIFEAYVVGRPDGGAPGPEPSAEMERVS